MSRLRVLLFGRTKIRCSSGEPTPSKSTPCDLFLHPIPHYQQWQYINNTYKA
ncbi:Hypothetical protein I595_2452 [Croceitalea dokdonensis DOKDO 023]|uniref:Uncharacterized protein n=1 Tax=Croceitalea dokdonensis DOKDO 023 TaxID=1300341 RepID=A0A0N8H3Q0_9FLAO|nr:Hypothetical protein I595_2452 [Croceitalea dokdonensis DOKDO 023]